MFLFLSPPHKKKVRWSNQIFQRKIIHGWRWSKKKTKNRCHKNLHTFGADSCPVLQTALKGLPGAHWACAERWWTGPGPFILLSLPVSASPPPVLPTNHNWQGTHGTLSTPMDGKSHAVLSQSGGINTGKERSGGGISPLLCYEGCRISINFMKDVAHHLLERSVFIYMFWETQMFESLRVKDSVRIV